MIKVESREDIIREIKSYELVLDNTYEKNHESFLLICDTVIVNGFAFRDVRSIRFVNDIMWIDNASIDVKDVKKFYISFTSIKYDLKDIKIQSKTKKSFKLE